VFLERVLHVLAVPGLCLLLVDVVEQISGEIKEGILVEGVGEGLLDESPGLILVHLASHR
jgi:hypothetical protein